MQKYFKQITKLRKNFSLPSKVTSHYNEIRKRNLGRWNMEWLYLIGLVALYLILSIDIKPKCKKTIQNQNN